MKLKKNYRFYVDSHCIECSTCSDIAGNYFKIDPDQHQAIVYQQPQHQQSIKNCLDACQSCPVGAIAYEH